MIIVIQCKDQVGLVAAVSKIVADMNISIVSLREYVDLEEKMFFLRLEIEPNSFANELEAKMNAVLPEGALCKINPVSEKKIVILVTKEYHCLADLIIRDYYKTLGAAIKSVIGNHENLKAICDKFDIKFNLVSYDNKENAERDIINLIDNENPDYIVLAKFMRVLSSNFVKRFKHKIINIHHSFLPAFIGANPYQKAYERGVKLIGATAHFVTDDLDEGPIIAQKIIPVSHYHTTIDMIKAGKEIETSVLSHALRLVFEDRVFVYKNKTVVFD